MLVLHRFHPTEAKGTIGNVVVLRGYQNIYGLRVVELTGAEEEDEAGEEDAEGDAEEEAEGDAEGDAEEDAEGDAAAGDYGFWGEENEVDEEEEV